MLVPERLKAGKGRCIIIHPHTTRAQRVQQKAIAKFTKTYQDTVAKQSTMAEGSSHGQPGPYFYQMGGKTYASLPTELLQGIRQCIHYENLLKDAATERVQVPENILAQDSKAHILTPQQYLQNVKEGKMPPMCNHNMLKEMAEKAGQANQTKFIMMEFRDFQRPMRPDTPAPQHKK